MPQPAETATPIVLGYVRDLYTGGQRFRSWQVGGIFALTCYLAVMCSLSLANRLPVEDSSQSQRLGAVLGAAFTVPLAAYIGTGIVAGWEDSFSLTTTGIRGRRRTVPWANVGRLAAYGNAGDTLVRLFYTVGSGDRRLPIELASSRPIPAPEYENIIARLQQEVLPSYPHLHLGGYERRPRSNGA